MVDRHVDEQRLLIPVVGMRAVGADRRIAAELHSYLAHPTQGPLLHPEPACAVASARACGLTSTHPTCFTALTPGMMRQAQSRPQAPMPTWRSRSGRRLGRASVIEPD